MHYHKVSEKQNMQSSIKKRNINPLKINKKIIVKKNYIKLKTKHKYKHKKQMLNESKYINI